MEQILGSSRQGQSGLDRMHKGFVQGAGHSFCTFSELSHTQGQKLECGSLKTAWRAGMSQLCLTENCPSPFPALHGTAAPALTPAFVQTPGVTFLRGL